MRCTSSSFENISDYVPDDDKKHADSQDCARCSK
jgi:hypothetical protein